MGAKPIERIDRHKDGSIKAKDCTIDGMLTGYWEWFRKDGTKMRSGYFENGKRAGEWMTRESRQSHQDEGSPLSGHCQSPQKAKAPPGGWGGALYTK
jgi:hypothetical protein